MKVYVGVRVLRAVVLGGAVGAVGHNDETTTRLLASAFVSEAVSCVPLYANLSSTLGGVAALAYSGDMVGTTLEVLESRMGCVALTCEAALLALAAVVLVVTAPSTHR